MEYCRTATASMTVFLFVSDTICYTDFFMPKMKGGAKAHLGEDMDVITDLSSWVPERTLPSWMESGR